VHQCERRPQLSDAGNWIKIRSNLWTDPRLDRLWDLSGHVEPMVIGGRYWLWTAADQHTEDGFMPGLSAAASDRKCGMVGLVEALLAVGWIELVAALRRRPGDLDDAVNDPPGRSDDALVTCTITTR
jgi:hypothetical protein